MSSIRSQSKHTRDRASAVGDLCGALSVGVDLSWLPNHKHQRCNRCCHTDSSSNAENWEDSEAAQSSSVSSPILSASLLHTNSILSNAHAEALTSFFMCNCSWAREHVSSENNYEIVIKCFKGKILPLIPVLRVVLLSPEPPTLLSCWFCLLPAWKELGTEWRAHRLGPEAILQQRHLFCCSNCSAWEPQTCPGDTFIIDTGENLNSHALKLSQRQNCGSHFM